MGEAAGGSSVPPPPAEAGGGQVNALTVLALLEKLVSMLEAVEGQQRQMEQRQRGLEGAVRGIQGDLGKLCRSHGATGEAVEKLLEKSRKVCAHTRAVRERLERQCAQVRRLEQHHAQLLRRDRFKVLIFQVRRPGGGWGALGAQPGTGGHGGQGPVLLAPSSGGKVPVPLALPSLGTRSRPADPTQPEVRSPSPSPPAKPRGRALLRQLPNKENKGCSFVTREQTRGQAPRFATASPTWRKCPMAAPQPLVLIWGTSPRALTVDKLAENALIFFSPNFFFSISFFHSP